jgi:hypothetical protein
MALIGLAIYLTPFFALGYFVKRAVDRWMKGSSLSDIRDQGGSSDRGQTRFLLGVWYRN